VTADGKKLFVVQKKKFAMVDIKPDQKFEKPMATGDIEVPVERVPNGGRSSPTSTVSSATCSTTRTCTAWTGPGCGIGTASCWAMR